MADAQRDFIAMEARRRQAAKLLQKGVRQAQVARLIGVSRQSVNRWARALGRNGARGLRRAERAGRKSRLDGRQRRQLARWLKAGAQASGFPTDAWTGPRVARLVEQQFGIAYRRTRALELLRELQIKAPSRARQQHL